MPKRPARSQHAAMNPVQRASSGSIKVTTMISALVGRRLDGRLDAVDGNFRVKVVDWRVREANALIGQASSDSANRGGVSDDRVIGITQLSAGDANANGLEPTGRGRRHHICRRRVDQCQPP
jgi:hypothetical protein